MYLYCAMADLANETGDLELLSACESLWEDLCLKRMYLTGGIGPSASNEGFTTHYDLPDLTAYAETCAAVGLVFWNHRLLQFEGNGKYADVMEKALYNGTISGVSLDGQRFFYENPLASTGKHHRKGWFDCACCPPNIARMIASVGEYMYSQGDEDAWVHLYAQGQARLTVGGKKLTVQQQTRYPWDGTVDFKITPEQAFAFGLHLRIPGWCQRFELCVNGTPVDSASLSVNGYVKINRVWQAGDSIKLVLDMPVQFVVAHPNVQQMAGRVAVQRGPVIYCLEGVDHIQAPLDDIVARADVPASDQFTHEFQPDLLGGVVVLRGKGMLSPKLNWDNSLYQFIPHLSQQQTPVPLTLVPYYAWDNRAPGEMRVWIRTL